MNRWLAIVVLVLAGLLTVGAVTLYLTYGISATAPRHANVTGLDGTARISWYRSGHSVIDADTEAKRYASLGFVHGTQHTWSVVLWRQTGLGRLAEWFGAPVVDVDEFTHTLALSATARQAYSRLHQEDRDLLGAYASGMNAALRTRNSILNPELSLLNVTPDPWEPWHVLVIERLFGWLSVPSSSIEILPIPSDAVGVFLDGNRKLRSFLHLHGFDESAAWTVRDSTTYLFAQRQVLGSSAVPVLSEVSYVQADSILFEGAGIPGTPFFVAGKTQDAAWSILMHGRAAWTTMPAGSVQIDTAFSRIRLPRGDELLVRTPRIASALAFLVEAPPAPAPDTAMVLSTPPVHVDSLWLLNWTGFTPISDIVAWRALLDRSTGSFDLLDGSGLVMQRDGTVDMLGSPRFSRTTATGYFAGNSMWGDFLAARLDSLGSGDDVTTARLPYLDDCYSAWAASLAPALVRTADQGFRHARVMEDALTYLRNWDYSYDRTSIGASVFDTWVRIHRDSTGTLPDAAPADTSYDARYRLYASLVHALNWLASRHGRELSEWRWEVVAPRRRFYPVWSTEFLPQVEKSTLPDTRYAPIELAAEGHPSALCWGPSPVSHTEPATEHWEAWVRTDSWDQLFVRRHRLVQDAFLSRYRITHQRPPAVIIDPTSRALRATVLRPTGANNP